MCAAVPFCQWALTFNGSTARPEDPIELRVYPGADGDFTIYEDQNDGYAYQQGAYATIPIHWNDETRTLTIGIRKGQFPGMLTHRTFNVVFVGDGHGAGIDPAAHPDKTVEYDGQSVDIAQ
jgi:alpha-D-xyloside xylohydrolase